MPTIIVDYSAKRPARDRYPKKIISPPFPRECCLTQMQRIGGRQVEENSRRWYFFYKRCTRCGFTVREFMSSVEMYRLLPWISSAGIRRAATLIQSNGRFRRRRQRAA